MEKHDPSGIAEGELLQLGQKQCAVIQLVLVGDSVFQCLIQQ